MNFATEVFRSLTCVESTWENDASVRVGTDAARRRDLDSGKVACGYQQALANRVQKSDKIVFSQVLEFAMTTKSAFSPEEWKVVREGPTTAGMIVITAAHGGTFRETFAMSKAYAEARAEHGETELLDEIVAARPEIDHTRSHSPEELREKGLAHLRDAVAIVESKATPQEVDGYRRFVLTLAHKVAAAHREGGQSESPAETEAIQEIATSLGSTGSQGATEGSQSG